MVVVVGAGVVVVVVVVGAGVVVIVVVVVVGAAYDLHFVGSPRLKSTQFCSQ